MLPCGLLMRTGLPQTVEPCFNRSVWEEPGEHCIFLKIWSWKSHSIASADLHLRPALSQGDRGPPPSGGVQALRAVWSGSVAVVSAAWCLVCLQYRSVGARDHKTLPVSLGFRAPFPPSVLHEGVFLKRRSDCVAFQPKNLR